MNIRQCIRPQHVSSHHQISKVSRYFRFLVKLCLFPLKIDNEKDELSFKFLSWQFGVFAFIINVGGILNSLSIELAFGHFEYIKIAQKYMNESNIADTVSGFGFFLQWAIFVICYFTFYKNLGKINKLNLFLCPKFLFGIFSRDSNLRNSS